MIKNKLNDIDFENKFKISSDKVKQCVKEICEDLNKYYENYNQESMTDYSEYRIIEETTGEIFVDVAKEARIPAYGYDVICSSLNKMDGYTNGDMIYLWDINLFNYVPCVFINAKTENDSAYEIVSCLFEDENSIEIAGMFSPITNTTYVREHLRLNEELKYTGSKNLINGFEDNRPVELINTFYENVFNRDSKSFFIDEGIKDIIPSFIKDEVIKVMDDVDYLDSIDKDTQNLLINLEVWYDSQ